MNSPLSNSEAADDPIAPSIPAIQLDVSNPPPITRRAVLILGMHRSGTSALTQVLHLCGLDLPADLLPGYPDNERGFFEPRKVIGIHDSMLHALGSSWDDLVEIPASALCGAETTEVRRDLLAALRQDLGDSHRFVLKDPRLCRLMPMWRLILTEFGAEPSCVLAIRNPLEIADSLRARDGISRAQSLIMWLQHFLESERHTRDLPRTFTSYDGLLDDWRTTIGRVEKDLSLGLRTDDPQVERQVLEFLEPALRHHSRGAEQWEQSDISLLVRRTYAWAQRAAVGQIAESAELDEIAAAVRFETAPFIQIISRQRQELKQAKEESNAGSESPERDVSRQRAAFNELAAHGTDLAAQLNAGRTEALVLQQDIAKLKTQLLAAKTKSDGLAAKLAAQQTEIDLREQQIALLESQQKRAAQDSGRVANDLAQARRQIDADRTEAAGLRKLADAADQNRAALQQKIDRIHASLSWKVSEPLRHAGRHAKRAMGKARLLAGAGGKNARELRQLKKDVAATGLFDPNYYLTLYPEVAEAQIDPLDHYVLYGSAQHRDPHPLFQAAFYHHQYPNVTATGIDPLLHFCRYGWKESRQPNFLFDSRFYLNRYPDVAASGINPLQHYRDAGWRESRNPHPLFDSVYYLKRYPEVVKAGMNPLEHYLRWGRSERRNPNAWFDARWYLATYPDVEAAKLDALQHYLIRGAAEGRDAGPIFNTEYYLKNFPQLVPLGINPLAHWMSEYAWGRVPERYWNRPAVLQRQLRPARTDAPAVLHALKHKPLISILVPTYNTPEKYLRAAVKSVQAQSYPHWELCICDDGSSDASTLSGLRELQRADPRITVRFNSTNGGISRATNDALSIARGQYVAMLDHDDELLPDALLCVVQSIDADPEVDVVYTDQAYVTPDGQEQEPLLKPDWSPKLLWGVMFVGHLLIVKRELANAVGGFDPKFDNVQDFEFMLRLSEKTSRIRHLSEILYYWRRADGSVSRQGDAKTGIPALQAAAVSKHLRRLRIDAAVEPHDRHAHRLALGAPAQAAKPPASIFIRPGGQPGALQRCLASIFSKTQYPQYKVFVVDDGKRQISLHEFADRAKIINGDPLLEGDDFKKISGDVWLSLRDDLEIVSPAWLAQLAWAASLPQTGYVCPLILQPGGSTVEEAGLIVGLNGSIDSAMRGWLADSDGHAGSLSCLREVSAVSDLCFAANRKNATFRAPDEKLYQDVRFRIAHRSLHCAAGQSRNLFVPGAILRFSLPQTDGSQTQQLDAMLFTDLWHKTIERGDPFHNLNFSRDGAGFR